MRRPAAGARSLRRLAALAALVVAAGLPACASTAMLAADEPDFGQTVRSALRAQELPTAKPDPAQGLSYSELEHGLDRYKAPPQSGAGAARSGAGAARPMLQ